MEPLLWQLYFEAIETHDGKRAAIREAKYGGPPPNLNAAQKKEHDAQMSRNIESRKTEILLSRRTLELQTLDLLCTQTALVPSAAARLADANVLPQLRQRLGRALDARAALAAEAAAAAEAAEAGRTSADGELSEKEMEIAEARAEALTRALPP